MDVKDSSKHPSAFATIGAQTALAVVWVSGLFSLVLCVIIIVNHIQVETADPLDDKMMTALKAAIAKDPADRETRETFRRLHLMARRAFFTNQTQMRTGGLLLLGSVAIFLGAMKTLVELKRVNPVPTGPIPMEGGTAERAAARWAVAAGGGVLVVVTLLVVYVSPPEIYLEVPGAAAAAVVEAPAAVPAPPPDVAPKATLPPVAWPGFRGPGGTATSSHPNVPLTWNGKTGEGLRWKKPIAKPGKSSVVVWGSRALATGSDGKTHELYAYDTESGELAWTGTLASTASKPYDVMDDVGHAAPTPATDGERVYALFSSGDIAAFSYDGKKLWSRSLGQPECAYGFGSSLAVHGGRVLVQFDDKKAPRFVALDGKTGQPAWEQKREVHEGYASPVIVEAGGRTQALLVGNPFLISYDPQSGKPLWRTETLKDVEIGPSAAVHGTTAYVTTDHAKLYAVDLAEGKILWKDYDEDLPDSSSPAATATHVFLCSSAGMVTCVDAKTGKRAWSQEFEEGFYASPILIGGRIYVMDRGGTMQVFKASGEKYESLAKNPLGEKADCTAAVAEGRIYLRSDKHLYSVGK